jgi:cell division septation protein DedD
MKKMLISLFVLAIGASYVGCSKDEDVAQLEQQIKEEESRDYLADSVSKKDTLAMKSVVAKPKEYAMTPEAAPEEEYEQEGVARAGQGGYTIQVAAGSKVENANYLRKKFANRGYEAFISQADVNGQLFYRVRIGSFESVGEARQVARELEDKYSVDYWIDYNQ